MSTKNFCHFLPLFAMRFATIFHINSRTIFSSLTKLYKDLLKFSIVVFCTTRPKDLTKKLPIEKTIPGNEEKKPVSPKIKIISFDSSKH